MRELGTEERRKFLMGLVAGTGALLAAEGCTEPDPTALINAKQRIGLEGVDFSQVKAEQLEAKLPDDMRVMIARKHIVALTKKDVATDLLRRLNIAKAAAPQDEAGKALVGQIDSIIAAIELGNKVFVGPIHELCW